MFLLSECLSRLAPSPRNCAIDSSGELLALEAHKDTNRRLDPQSSRFNTSTRELISTLVLASTKFCYLCTKYLVLNYLSIHIIQFERLIGTCTRGKRSSIARSVWIHPWWHSYGRISWWGLIHRRKSRQQNCAKNRTLPRRCCLRLWLVCLRVMAASVVIVLNKRAQPSTCITPCRR